MNANLVPGSPQTLQPAATTGSGGTFYPAGACRYVTITLQGTGTTSGGVVTIEEAYYDKDAGTPYYAGTWSSITTMNASDVSGGKQQALHLTGSYWAIRARISTEISGGGTVTVVAWAN